LARHSTEKWLPLHGSQAFIGPKHKELVVDNRPAGSAAELIAFVIRLRGSEEVLRIESIVAVKLVRGTVQLVGARLRDDGNDRLALAVLGRDRIAQQADFLNGVD